jgi:RNase P subunit RPR2
MIQGDGTRPKFRVLCRRCNSYLHTTVLVSHSKDTIRIVCRKCGNAADSFLEEEAEA